MMLQTSLLMIIIKLIQKYMINPLKNRGLNKSSMDKRKVDKKETENEIYCVMCEKKYLIEAYK